MSNPNIAKLKKRAADFEAKKQFDRALSLYIQLLEEAGRDLDDGDLQLFNRVGDLLQRQGNVSEALAYYEKAVDVYAERGFLNNAIALCNKILRQSPARTAVYYKLGKISATKGFKSDAKKNFLEYADRMQKAGHVDEAFRALKEFADLCPDQDDIRLMLAEWLNKENRKSEAIEQLEVLYSKLESEGRQAEARATIDRIKAIDPAVTPRASGAWQAQKSNDLVFLDLEAEMAPPPAAARVAEESAASEARARTPATPAAPRIPALDGLILTFDPDTDELPADVAPAAATAAVEGLEVTGRDVDDSAVSIDAAALAGLERVDAIVAPDEVEVPSLLSAESRLPFASPEEPIPLITGLETPRVSLSGAHPALAPLLDEPPLSGTEFADLALHESAPIVPPVRPSAAHDLALPSDLPLLGEDEAAIDLLGVVSTPVGGDATSSGATPAIVDLDALPPVGEVASFRSAGETPVTGSHSPIVPDDAPSIFAMEFGTASGSPSDAASDIAGDVASDIASDVASDIAGDVASDAADGTLASATGVHVHEEAGPGEAHPEAPEAATEQGDDTSAAPLPVRAREDRDTSELIAVDGTSRSTDEILIVPSEVIDEETKRSLRLEFALDGDETPDAWVEAALGSRDDRSMDQTMDRLLTPLGMEAIVMPPPSASDAPPAVEGRDDEVRAEQSGAEREPDFSEAAPPAAPFAAHAEAPEPETPEVAERVAEIPADVPARNIPTPAVIPEFDLLDELTPPFMRHEAEQPPAAAPKLDEAPDALAAGGSALDVDALRALIDQRDSADGEAGAGERAPALGGTPAGAASAGEVELVLDERQIEAAFEDAAVELPLLDIEGVVPPADDLGTTPGLEVSPFSVDDLLGEAPSFGTEGTLAFIPDPLFDVPAADADVAGSRNDARDGEPSDEADVADAGVAGAEAARAGNEPPSITDEWPVDAAPEVLIDGEWRDEHMGDLVSGEVRAVTSFDPSDARRTPRFDDLSAALMWPSEDDGEGASAHRAPDESGVGAGSTPWVRRGVHAHTPHSNLSFGGVEAQLRRRLEIDPGNLSLRQQLGEALLDQGAREDGLAELDAVMRGYETIGNLEAARAVADVVLRVVPTSVRHHQKRVEYAVRSNDRVRLVEAYVELADSLFRSGEPDKARVVYARVLELAPGNGRARFALGLLEAEETSARATTPRDSASEPTPQETMSALFDPAVARPTPLRGVTPQFVTLPLIDETADGASGGETGLPSLSDVDVHDLVAGERLDAEQREQAEQAEQAGLAGQVEAVDDVTVTPFPPPSLDESIDAAFAAPPMLELAPEGAAGAPIVADVEDFAGTPPLGAAALVTPRAGDDAAEPIDHGYLLPAPTDPETHPAVEQREVDASASEPDAGSVEAPGEPAVEDFIDLGSWLREDEPVRSTRMITQDAPPTGDEQADFDEMLRRFKQGVAANVDEEDYASHYDLGVAYKEMGLVDEAIAEFQKSLRGETHRVRSYEALGQCFVEKGQHQVAVTLLRRAVESTGADDQQLVGVLYLLGYASEVLARHADALGYYQRVFAVDIEFRDVAQRVAAMEHKTQ